FRRDGLVEEQPGEEEEQRHVEAVDDAVSEPEEGFRHGDTGAVQPAHYMAVHHQHDTQRLGMVHPYIPIVHGRLSPPVCNLQPVENTAGWRPMGYRLANALPVGRLFMADHSPAADVLPAARNCMTLSATFPWASRFRIQSCQGDLHERHPF